MESKTKQRIVGICVVIGLVIVLLPLFQMGKESSSEATLVKAPPFPEPATQVAASDSAADLSLVQDDTLPEQTLKSSNTDTAQPKSDAQSLVESQDQKQPQDQAQKQNQAENTQQPNLLANRPSIINDRTQTNSSPAAVTSNTDAPENVEKSDLNSGTANPGMKAMELAPVMPEDDEQAPSVANVKQANEVKTPAHQAVMHTAANQHSRKVNLQKQLAANKAKLKPIKLETALNDNGLVSIKSSAWVVQIGSFKNKSNALRLVNKLRMNGYHAFMQHVAMTSGENTRVFVGPENQHARAQTLANRLESDMHIKTIVISYKPLTL